MEAKWTVQGWYYIRDGQQVGPFSTSEMQDLSIRIPFTSADEVFLGWQRGDEIKLIPTRTTFFLPKTRSKSTRSGRFITG